jgi:Alr-MurF fusion protein
MLFSELATITGGTLSGQPIDGVVNKFSLDTRTLSGHATEVFVAIKGTQTDGHQFVQQAWDKGIRFFIVERAIWLPGEANILQVESSIDALQKIAAHHRRQFHYPVIAITGSNGKTTVKEWLGQLLSRKYRLVKSPKSYNSQIGVPLSVLEMGHHEIAVFEAGISRPDEMEKLAEIIHPTIGILTNIGEAHSEGFISKEDKLDEKIRLFESCKKIICSSDQILVFDKLKKNYPDKLVTWSFQNADADYQITKSGIQFQISGKVQCHFSLDFSDGHFVENVMHAVVCALECGIKPEEINVGVRQFKPLPMRLVLKRGRKGCYIVDDSYNNDLLGLEIALDFTNRQNQKGKRTLILSDILQSGLSDHDLYKRVAQLCQQKNFHRVIGIGPSISANESVFQSNKQFFESVDKFLENTPVFEDEIILVKGARPFGFERIVKSLEDKAHATVLEINFEALRHNLNMYRNLLNPGTKMMVMVKAFAYGAGLSEIANWLQYEKVDYLGVAYVDEAIQLRQDGITASIMIMNPAEDQFGLFERFGLEAEIYSINVLRKFLQYSLVNVPIHLKIETGMNRLGIGQEDVDELIELLKENPQVHVAGVFTHFSSSDEPGHDDFTRKQADIFERVYHRIATAIGKKPIKHALNSPGISRWPQFQFDMVRLGIGLYGFDPTSKLALQTVGILKTYVTQLKEVKAGESVGYSRKGVVTTDTVIAILPIGYADGYLRSFGNGKAYVKINGQDAHIIGNVCMDMVMVDVTGLNINEGDEAIIFGQSPTISELADWAGTIPYEILTNISQRVKRVYVSE